MSITATASLQLPCRCSSHTECSGTQALPNFFGPRRYLERLPWNFFCQLTNYRSLLPHPFIHSSKDIHGATVSTMLLFLCHTFWVLGKARCFLLLFISLKAASSFSFPFSSINSLISQHLWLRGGVWFPFAGSVWVRVRWQYLRMIWHLLKETLQISWSFSEAQELRNKNSSPQDTVSDPVM